MRVGGVIAVGFDSGVAGLCVEAGALECFDLVVLGWVPGVQLLADPGY